MDNNTIDFNLIGNENNIVFYTDEELEEDSICAKIAHMGNNNKQQYITKNLELNKIKHIFPVWIKC